MAYKVRTVSAMVALATIGVVGCRDQTGGTIPEAESAVAFSQSRCSTVEMCGCFDDDQGAPDRQTCESTAQEQWNDALAAAKGKGLAYDGACVRSILELDAIVGCLDDVDGEEVEREVGCAPCKVVYGAKEMGESCEPFNDLVGFGDDCVQGLRCGRDGCYDPCVVVGEGEVCSLAECELGLHCVDDASSEPRRCHKPAELGDSCIDLPCADGLRCFEESFTCQPPPKLGEPCFFGVCGEGYCATETRLCTELTPIGAPCEVGEQCVGGLCDGATCLEPSPPLCWFY